MLIDYECDDGKLEKINLQDYLDRLVTFTIQRLFSLHNIMFPLLMSFAYVPSDRRYARNVKRFRDIIRKMIEQRRSGQTHSYS